MDSKLSLQGRVEYLKYNSKALLSLADLKNAELMGTSALRANFHRTV